MTNKQSQFIIQYNYEKPTNYTDERIEGLYSSERVNKNCGDVIEVFVDIENGTIKRIHFTGNGCVLSIASTSIMIDIMTGCKKSDAIKKNSEFITFIDEGRDLNNLEIIDSRDITALNSIKKFSARISCIKLGWAAVGDVLRDHMLA